MAVEGVFRKRDMDLFDFMTGKSLGRHQDYGDEVLDAGWLPQPEAALASRRPSVARSHTAVSDPDAFLRDIYRSQE
jgi:hypothetical protein